VEYFSTPDPLLAGVVGTVTITLETADPPGDWTFVAQADTGRAFPETPVTRTLDAANPVFDLQVVFTDPGPATVVAELDGGTSVRIELPLVVADAIGVIDVPDARVALVADGPPPSEDAVLWTFIQSVTDRLRFNAFNDFVVPRLSANDRLDWFGNESYRQLRRLADEFLLVATDPVEAVNSGATDLQLGPAQAGIDRSYVSTEGGDQSAPFPAVTPLVTGPQLQLLRAPRFGGPVTFPLPNVPFVELIWNYWMEEGMLVQTLNHILARFQNRRLGRRHDPLVRFDVSPLLPLRNLLWGFAETEVNRLTVRRRAAEYLYQYGLQLLGRAVPPPSRTVQQRTQFVEAFHTLLNASYAFFKESDDRTVTADAFDLISNLREVHLLLSHGAANQFADLAVVARAEMLSMQWILAQPEMREFLGGPSMVPYDEPWMDRVDTMKKLQGWSDTSISHFFELAVLGEQIVLSVRHGRWNEATQTREDAANWALTWRNAIQRYIHAYRAVTGADLTTAVDATMPSVLIARRMRQRMRA
jgi:hypothetical protein